MFTPFIESCKDGRASRSTSQIQIFSGSKPVVYFWSKTICIPGIITMDFLSHPSTTFIMPSRLSMQHTTRQSRRGSTSSLGSWSSSSDSSFPKAAVGPLPIRKFGDISNKPRLIGVPTPRDSSSEHWRSFHRRFQAKPKNGKAKNYSVNQSEGIWSKIANRIFVECPCQKDDWVDDREVPLRRRFWDEEGREADEEECRVDLTE